MMQIPQAEIDRIALGSAKNPFPSYPVSSLRESPGDIRSTTHRTKPIDAAAAATEAYLNQFIVASPDTAERGGFSPEDMLRHALRSLADWPKVASVPSSRRAQDYEARINSGDLVSIAEVARELFVARDGGEQGIAEQQMLDSAVSRLARQIAVTEGSEEHQARERIFRILGEATVARGSEGMSHDEVSDPVPRGPTLRSVSGDFGTGKTHLLRFVRAQLEDGQAVVLTVAGTHADYVHWFNTHVCAALRELNLIGLLTRLLAKCAAEVAGRAILTQSLTAELERNPQSVFNMFANNLLGKTEIDRLFLRRIDEASPDGSTELRKALAALPWQVTGAAAVRWLTVTTPQSDDYDILGINRPLVAEHEAAPVLGALAGIANQLRQPFGLLIDEFEHLIDFDRQNGNRRNATWIKRLLESLGQQNALVFIAGHWAAFSTQKSDFSARFGGSPPILLAALGPGDVCEVANKLAPEWANPLPALIGEAIAKRTRGSIRRVLALLRILYSKNPVTSYELEEADVADAALELDAVRRDETPFENVLSILAKCAETEACQLIQPFAIGTVSFDATLVKDGRPILVIDYKSIAHQSALFNALLEFSSKVSGLRRNSGSLSGVMVVSGATDADVLNFASGLPDVRALSSDDPSLGDILAREAAAAVRNQPSPITPESEEATFAIRSGLSQLGDVSHEAASQTLTRVQMGVDEGGRSSHISGSLLREIQPESSPYRERRKKVSELLAPENPPTLVDVIFRRGWLVASLAIALLGTLSTPIVARMIYEAGVFIDPLITTIVQLLGAVLLTVTLLNSLLLCYRERTNFRYFMSWRFNYVEEMIARGLPEADLIRICSDLSMAPKMAGGYRDARDWAMHNLPQFSFESYS